jgi:hypothetical protein
VVKHRGLNLQRFIYALPWDLFEAYFTQIDANVKPEAWAWLNAEMLFKFLDDDSNAEASVVIVEDFRRINDLGFYLNFLLHAYDRAGIVWREDEPGEAGAMRLFLGDREAFEYGWTLYVLQTTLARRCEFYFPAGELQPTPEQVERLRANLSGWFASIKRGDHCRTNVFLDGPRLYIRIARGKKLTTFARWRGHEVTFETFRPASEDVLTYEAAKSTLCLFGGNRRDRERYIRSVAEYVAEDVTLADTALNTPVISLEPFQKGTFSLAGDSAIRRIWLQEVEFVDIHGTVQTLRGPYLRASLASQNLSLAELDLRLVGVRMEIQAEGDKRATDCVVVVQPPGFTDIAKQRHADIIESYFKQQGVKLI